VSVDTTYADSGTDPTVKLHQQHHDVLHAFANKFDTATPSNGNTLVWNSTTQLWVPGTTGGTPDHGTLPGLADDDHPQYYNQARGDARYGLKTVVDDLVADVAAIDAGTPVVVITDTAYAALNPPDPDTVYVITSDTVTPPPPTATVEDAFAATESPPVAADTGQLWRVELGTWNQTAGTLRATADGAIIVQDLGVKTQTIEFTINGTLVANSAPGPVMLYDNSNDWHYRVLRGSSGQLAIHRRDPTQTTIWTSNNNLINAGDKVRVAVTGASGATAFRVWVNDGEVTLGASGSLTDTDGTPPAGTECGFRYSFGSGGDTYTYGPTKMWNTVQVP
jgi:hypothetical protein